MGIRLIVFGVALGLLSTSVVGAPLGVNLLVNGDAESGAASVNGEAVTIPGWGPGGAPTVVKYGTAGGFPTSNQGPYVYVGSTFVATGGQQFFAGGNGPAGNGSATSTLAQSIDVSGNAADIDAGKVTCDISGWFGGFANQDDQAQLIVFFKAADNSDLGNVATGTVTAADRNSRTLFQQRAATAVVPAKTRSLIAALVMTRAANTGQGTFNDGYADNLSVVIRSPYVVTTTADSGAGSLRAAIAAGNTITFDPAVFPAGGPAKTITLLSALPNLSGDMSIAGPGKGVLTVQRSSASGTPQFPIFVISNGGPTGPTVSLSGLTLSNGNSANQGGAIFSDHANLVVNDCVITGNHSDFDGGGIFKYFGALTMNRCTISQNSTGAGVSPNKSIGGGGGISNDNGALTLNNCTLSGNTSNYHGSGLSSAGSDVSTTVTLTNCTISGNSSSENGVVGGIYSTSYTSTNLQPANLVLASCTLNNNSSFNIFVDNGGSPSSLTISNTILRSGGSGANLGSFNNAVITSQGYNMSDDAAGGFLNKTGDKVNTDAKLGPLQDNGGPTFTHALLPGSPAIDKGNTSLASDQRGAPRPIDDPNSANGTGNLTDIGAVEYQLPTLANISSRLRSDTGDNVLIAGFIVTGTQSKKIIVRAIGPSLPFAGTMADPTLELHDSTMLLEANDNWGDSANKAAITASGLAPGNALESAIVRVVQPGAYTAIVRGQSNGTGIAVVEAFDLDAASTGKMVNISTRGLVETGDNVLIAGTIVVGPATQKVIIRALGPSVPVTGAMADPTLDLYDSNGAVLESNDNWVDSANKQAILDTGLPPSNNKEAAITRTLSPANYTAIVRGANGTTGIAVVEVYALQ